MKQLHLNDTTQIAGGISTGTLSLIGGLITGYNNDLDAYNRVYDLATFVGMFEGALIGILCPPALVLTIPIGYAVNGVSAWAGFTLGNVISPPEYLHRA